MCFIKLRVRSTWMSYSGFSSSITKCKFGRGPKNVNSFLVTKNMACILKCNDTSNVSQWHLTFGQVLQIGWKLRFCGEDRKYYWYGGTLKYYNLRMWALNNVCGLWVGPNNVVTGLLWFIHLLFEVLVIQEERK